MFVCKDYLIRKLENVTYCYYICSFYPQNLHNFCFYIYRDNYISRLIFYCPKCLYTDKKHIIELNLNKNLGDYMKENKKKKRYWEIKFNGNLITLHTSIQLKTKCKAHFEIINSQIEWK